MDSINSVNDVEKVSREADPETNKSHKWLWMGFFLLLLAGAYFVPAAYFSGHYLPNTTINGVDVSLKTPQEAMDIFSAEVQSYSLTLIERDDRTEVIKASDIGLRADFGTEYTDALSDQSRFVWPASFLSSDERSVSRAVKYNEEKLKKVIAALNCMDESSWYPSENAVISDYDADAGEFTITEAVYGTQVIEDNLVSAIDEALSKMSDSVDLAQTGCYVEPRYTSSSEEIIALLDEVNALAASTVTLTFDSVNEVIDGSVMRDWMDIDYDAMTVDIDYDTNAAKYVEKLAAKYDTVGKDKTLKTSWGTTVTVNAGTYGWQMDQEATAKLILKYLKSGKDYTGDAVYTQEAESHDGNDYGDTYIEVNISKQHLFVYIDGEQVASSDFVSGCVSKNRCTDLGAYFVAYKQEHATLRGQGYSTPVDYWMPFFCGEGLHDATWRYSFGGSIFLTNGSHGCVNLPHSVAKEIYDLIEPGIAVLVYDPDGVQANAKTYYQSIAAQQEAKSEAAVNKVISLIDKIGKVTKKSKKAINKARSAYDALSDEQKKQVTNYKTLKAAEKKYAKLTK